MLFILEQYNKFYPGNEVPFMDIRLSMEKESNGHAASFMSLLAMYHDLSPNSGGWPGTLMDHYFNYLNGVKRTTVAELQSQIIRDAVYRYLPYARAERWGLRKDLMTEGLRRTTIYWTLVFSH
jgi:hypothetical protein